MTAFSFVLQNKVFYSNFVSLSLFLDNKFWVCSNEKVNSLFHGLRSFECQCFFFNLVNVFLSVIINLDLPNANNFVFGKCYRKFLFSLKVETEMKVLIRSTGKEGERNNNNKRKVFRIRLINDDNNNNLFITHFYSKQAEYPHNYVNPHNYAICPLCFKTKCCFETNQKALC